MSRYKRSLNDLKTAKTKRNHLKKIKWIAIFMSVALLAIIILLTSTHIYNSKKGEFIVSRINNEEVTYREFTQVMSKKRANTINYFKQKYNVENGPGFWVGNFGGENPLEKIKKDTLEELTKTKVLQALAKKYSLVTDVSYKKFLKDLSAENQKRKKALDNKQVIYGVQKYTEDTYYDIVNSNLFFDLQEKMTKEIKITDKEMKSYYEENKNKMFLTNDIINTEILTVSKDKNIQKENADIGAKEIKLKINQGESFEAVAKLYKEDSQYKVEQIEYTFGPESARTDSKRWPKVAEGIKKLDIGQISDVIEDYGTFYIVKCTGKTPGTFIEFDKAKENITKILGEQKYNETIDNLTKKANVEIVKKIYNMFGASDLD
jgi:parvulin-like peptidyl-prolyl isomerase